MYSIPQPSFPFVEGGDDQSGDEPIKARWAKFSAMRANAPISTVQASQATIPQFFNVKGSQKGMPYPGLDGHQRRIIPIPVSPPKNPSPMHQNNKSPEEIHEGVSELISEAGIGKERSRGAGTKV